MAEPTGLPLELTAPLIQRLARKGLAEPLSEAERLRLCECVLHHVDAVLAQRRIPRVGPEAGLKVKARIETRPGAGPGPNDG